MASWKKVIVSGSNISALNNDANYISTTGANIVSSSAQIAADISGSGNVRFEAINTATGSINTRIESLNTKTGSLQTEIDALEAVDFTAGTGLTGGGTLASNRTFNVASANNGIVANADNIELAVASSTFTGGVKDKLNAEGVISASAQIEGDFLNTTGDAVLSGSAQIAADISGSGNVRFEALNTKTGSLQTEIDALEAVDFTAGTGLTGGGTLASNRTFNVVSANNGIVANANDIELDVNSSTFTGGVDARINSNNSISASVLSSPSQGTATLTTNGVATAVDLGLQTGDAVTFASLVLTGNLEVRGTQTTISSSTLDIGDNIVALNGTGAALGGLHVNDANGPASGSLLWDGTNNKWIGGASGSEVDVAFLKGQGLVSGSAAQVRTFINVEDGADVTDATNVTAAGALMDSELAEIATVKALTAAGISGSFVSASNALGSRIDNVSSTITLSADSGTNDTYTTGETLTFEGDNSITTTVSDNKIAISIANGVVSGSAQLAADISGSGNVRFEALNTATGSLNTRVESLNTKTGSLQTEIDALEAVDFTAGTGLTGGGTLASNRTFNVASANNGIVANANDIELDVNSSTFTGGVDARINSNNSISASVISSPNQGTARLAVNGVNTDADLGLQTGDSPTFAGLTLTGTATGTNLTLSGDLNVSGTVTNVNSTDLNIEDKFILLNSGSASGNSGIIAQNSGSNGLGTALFFDDTANRWSLDYSGANANTDVVAADARIAAVAIDEDDANYQKNGNIFVSGSGDVFIYVE
jgi:chaperonin cofactor prefoldin